MGKARYPNQIHNLGDVAWRPEEDIIVPRPEDAFMPVWKRPVAASHRDSRRAGGTAHHKAGYPDFILYYAPAWKKQSAIIEVKTSWAYRRDILEGIFTQMCLTNDNRGFLDYGFLPPGEVLPGLGGGYFDWRENGATADLVKQVSYSNRGH